MPKSTQEIFSVYLQVALSRIVCIEGRVGLILRAYHALVMHVRQPSACSFRTSRQEKSRMGDLSSFEVLQTWALEPHMRKGLHVRLSYTKRGEILDLGAEPTFEKIINYLAGQR